jgi:CBS domain-containing protein
MNVKIADLMIDHVVTTTPHSSLGHVREMMNKNGISAIPVVNTNNEPLGIVTSNDFRKDIEDASPVSTVLSGNTFQVPAYNDISVAAKVMLKHKIHHVLVTHEKQFKITLKYDVVSFFNSLGYSLSNLFLTTFTCKHFSVVAIFQIP